MSQLCPGTPCLQSLLRGEVSIHLRATHKTESLPTSQPTCRLPQLLDSARCEYHGDTEAGNAAGSRGAGRQAGRQGAEPP